MTANMLMSVIAADRLHSANLNLCWQEQRVYWTFQIKNTYIIIIQIAVLYNVIIYVDLVVVLQCPVMDLFPRCCMCVDSI